MKTFFAVAALMMASSSVQAGNSFSFEINGHKIHVAVPDQCDDAYCLSVSASGLRAATSALDKLDGDTSSLQGAEDATPEVSAPRKTQTATATPQGASAAPPVANAESAVMPSPARVAPAAIEKPIVSAAPQPSATPADPTSPLGVWVTEKKEGKVHVVECGTKLCGYVVDAKSNQDGDEILIDMERIGGGTKWKGRLRDTRDGSIYDSTISLGKADTLRVQGCAFGGFVCGGQTWSRG